MNPLCEVEPEVCQEQACVKCVDGLWRCPLCCELDGFDTVTGGKTDGLTEYMDSLAQFANHWAVRLQRQNQ